MIIWYIFPDLVFCSQKNLATLSDGIVNRKQNKFESSGHSAHEKQMLVTFRKETVDRRWRNACFSDHFILGNPFYVGLGRAWILRALLGMQLYTLGSGFCVLEHFIKYVGIKRGSGSGFTK
jgi:hypothetical protein